MITPERIAEIEKHVNKGHGSPVSALIVSDLLSEIKRLREKPMEREWRVKALALQADLYEMEQAYRDVSKQLSGSAKSRAAYQDEAEKLRNLFNEKLSTIAGSRAFVRAYQELQTELSALRTARQKDAETIASLTKQVEELVKQAQEDFEYHSAKLNVAKVKAKEDSHPPQPPTRQVDYTAKLNVAKENAKGGAISE